MKEVVNMKMLATFLEIYLKLFKIKGKFDIIQNGINLEEATSKTNL